MKNLLLRLAAVAAAVVVTVWAASAAYYQSLQVWALSTSGMPERITVANTGNSHGLHAFDYAEIEGGFNFALGSQPLQYDLSLIQKYIGRFEPGAVLFIPLSFMSFWGDPTQDSQYEALTMRYMGLLDADGLVLKSRADALVFKYFSIVRYADIQTGSIFLARMDRVVDASASGLTIPEIGPLRAEYHARLALEGDALRPMFAPSVDALRALVTLCLESGVRPVLLTTPYTRYYADAVPARMLEAFYAQVAEICAEFSVEYRDYSRDARFDNLDFFEDSDHLNARGAELFTQIAMSEAIGGNAHD